MRKTSTIFILSLIFGAVLLGIPFLLIQQSFDPGIVTGQFEPPIVCPQNIIMPTNSNWFNTTWSAYLEATNKSTCGHGPGWWSAGWPLALSSDFLDQAQFAWIFGIIIIDFIFWSLLSFIVLMAAKAVLLKNR